MSRNLLHLLVTVLCFGCAYEDVSTSQSTKLLRITANGKTDQSFEYYEGRLVKENFFSFCTNPSDEYIYSYQDGKLIKIKTTLRSLYSSIAAICDPASGINAEENFEYNAEGRISKITRANSYTEFFYNSRGLVEKQILYGGPNAVEANFKYDSYGNLSEASDWNGNTTQFEYDNKRNPYYLMNQKPGWISPFNTSPNNVIKATGAQNFERSFEYNDSNLPKELLDTNGLTYFFVYE